MTIYDQTKTKSEIIDKLMIRDGFIFLIIQTHLKSLPISPPELLLATNLPSVLPGILFISFVFFSASLTAGKPIADQLYSIVSLAYTNYA